MSSPAYIGLSGNSTPISRSPRALSSPPTSTPDYKMFLHDLDENPSDKTMAGFQVIHKSSDASDLSELAPTKILLLLTPVAMPETATIRNSNKERQDPFETFGKKLSKKHRRIRHVPYLASVGLTATHEAFMREADAVVFVTVPDLASTHGSVPGRHDRSLHQERWEGLAKPYVLLRYGSGERTLRADSPHEDMAESPFPTEQQFDDAVDSLFRPTKV